MSDEKNSFLVFSGTSSRYLAEKICNSLGCPLGNMNITHFADGEFAVSYEVSIRGQHDAMFSSCKAPFPILITSWSCCL